MRRKVGVHVWCDCKFSANVVAGLGTDHDVLGFTSIVAIFCGILIFSYLVWTAKETFVISYY